MIIKEVDSITSKDKFLQAGSRAEKQMAHYLSRAFKDAKDILVLNGIRLKSEDDSCQIDHLIIHKYGMIIIESKSVVGPVEINERNEWSRSEYNLGMASPVLQGKRQAAFLKKYLNESGLEPPHDPFKSLVRKITFDHVPVDVLVAISDKGDIRPHPSVDIDNVHKADVIPEKIEERISYYRRLDRVFSLDPTPTPLKMKLEAMNNIAQFLVKKHTPYVRDGRRQARQPKTVYDAPRSAARGITGKSQGPNRKRSVSVAQDQARGFVPASGKAGFRCKDCGNEVVRILWGRHGYYFSCSGCPNTMTAKGYCKECGQQSKLSKAGNRFYVKCEEHGKGDLFFTNPS